MAMFYDGIPFIKRCVKSCHTEIHRAWESSRARFLSRAFNRRTSFAYIVPKLIPDGAIYEDTYAYIRLTLANDTRRACTHTLTINYRNTKNVPINIRSMCIDFVFCV